MYGDHCLVKQVSLGKGKQSKIAIQSLLVVRAHFSNQEENTSIYEKYVSYELNLYE